MSIMNFDFIYYVYKNKDSSYPVVVDELHLISDTLRPFWKPIFLNKHLL